ncbi:MAG: IS982 family transposase [Chloroflexi bacterium]|nr:MAG: IS982 family transposase [Chloroflexota bacterium]
MDTQIIVVFCLCADMLQSLHHVEDRQCQMSDAEVMTTAIVAMLYYKGNFCLASQYLYEQGYIPNMLSRSRFNRRLHRIADLFLTLFLRLGETWKQLNEKSVYVIDSYPIAVCDNYRIQRSKIYHGEDFRGYLASKKRYFYGLRIHILVTEQGEPVEFFLEPGAFSDTRALGLYNFDLPEGSFVTGDKAYNNYTIEDVMREAGLELIPIRKKNSLRPVPAYMTYFQACIRKIIETTGSLIERLLPKSIHAVTAKGFELKVALFVLACSINFLW